MPTRSILALVLGASILSGCLFQNLSPTRQLTDQVYALNDETRWGRTDLAAHRVVPRFRGRFMTSHRGWGRTFHIADTEVSALTLTDEDMSATSLVEVSWYDLDTMEVRTTVLRQHWVKTESGFMLDNERVIDGDDELLRVEEEREMAERSPAG